MDRVQKAFLIKLTKGAHFKYKINHDYTTSILTNRLHLDVLLHYATPVYMKGRLLDAGCGEKPYSLIYRDLVDNAIGVDVKNCIHDQSEVDIFASLDNLPFEDNQFDVVLCTNVIEHVANGEDAFKELSRILKPGGTLILSVPFLYPLHEAPYDFHRYTKYGLEHMISKYGLKMEHLHALGGPGMFFLCYFHLFVTRINLKFLNFIFCWSQELIYSIYRKFCLKSILTKDKKINNIITTGFFLVARK